MHFQPGEITELINFIEDTYNPVVHKAFQFSKRQKTLIFKIENKRAEVGQSIVRKFFLTYDNVNHIRIGKTRSRLIYMVEDPQRDALTKKRNILNAKLTPEFKSANPAAARKLFDQMQDFHNRLQSSEFNEPRYVITTPERSRFEQAVNGSPANYNDFAKEYKDILVNEFLPKLKKIFPYPEKTWWGLKQREIQGRYFHIFETYDYKDDKPILHKRFILSHVEEAAKLSMVYGLDSKNKTDFLFGLYRKGEGEGKFGSINDRLLFPEVIIKAMDERERLKKEQDRAEGQDIQKSFKVE